VNSSDGTKLVAALEREPDNPVRWYRLSEYAKECGNLALWRQGVEIAFQQDHQTMQSKHYRALAKIRLGEWQGWHDRYAARYISSPLERQLRWVSTPYDGIHNLSEQTLLIIDEHGFGDALQTM
jgi:hypothetical protein